MTDPRTAQRAIYARWLGVRNRLRTIVQSLAASEHALQRDARRSAEPEFIELACQVRAQRAAIDALSGDVEARLARMRAGDAAVEAAFLQRLTAAARKRAQI